MKVRQTQNTSQFASEPRALQNEVLAFFNRVEGENKKFRSIKTFMLVTMTNFAANSLQSDRTATGNARPKGREDAIQIYQLA